MRLPLSDDAPLGTVMYYFGPMDGITSPPNPDPPSQTEQLGDKWLRLDGRTIQKSEYPELHQFFAENGMLSGLETGTSPGFSLPNLMDRMVVGAGGSVGALGTTGGSLTHDHGSHGTHTTNTTHTHDSHTTANRVIGVGSSVRTAPTTHSADGGHTHDAHSAHSAASAPFFAFEMVIKARP